MRLYCRSKKVDLNDTICLCDFDGDYGRVKLALDRLHDLAEELGPDAKITYAEGLIRASRLGQGIEAYHCFVKALELDSSHLFAACNAANFAPDEETFRRWADVADKLSPSDSTVQGRNLMRMNFLNNSYTAVRLNQAYHYQEKENLGFYAAFLQLALENAATEMNPHDTFTFIKQYAITLRKLDIRDEKIRENIGEEFIPSERLALSHAILEIERALELDEYDPELWNFKAAWCYLMENYEESIRCADRAIALNRVNYPKPYLNKCMSLWKLTRAAEALVCAQEGLNVAQESLKWAEGKLPPGQLSLFERDVQEAQTKVSHYAYPPTPPEPTSVLPFIESTLNAALKHTADAEMGQLKATLNHILVAFQERLKHLLPATEQNVLEYVPAMAQAFAYMTPESVFGIIQKISVQDATVYRNCMRAALYITAQGEGIMRRDAVRFVILNIFTGMDAFMSQMMWGADAVNNDWEYLQFIQKAYRQWVLSPSMAALEKGHPIQHVLLEIRTEMLHMNRLYIDIIANQDPPTNEEKRAASLGILAPLTGTPFVNHSENFPNPAELSDTPLTLMVGTSYGNDSNIVKNQPESSSSPSSLSGGCMPGIGGLLVGTLAITLPKWLGFTHLSWSQFFPKAIPIGIVCFLAVFWLLARRTKMDPGFVALETGKSLWQDIPELTPYLWYGKINPAAATKCSDPIVVAAKKSLQQAIDGAAQSNFDTQRAQINAAIALQELGLLHRALNEFDEAKNLYLKSKQALEMFGGYFSTECRVLAIYRENLFRLGELEQTLDHSDETIWFYTQSLQIDEKLGHDDPSGEQITRQLLQQLEKQRKTKTD